MARAVVAMALLFTAYSAQAAREPALKQIDLPHAYYYPRDVPAAADERPVERYVLTGRRDADLQHGGLAVAPERRCGDRNGAHARTWLRLTFDESGWVLLRAWNDGADPLILDLYPYATTSPIYVNVGGNGPVAVEDARYFVRWMDRVIAATQAREDFNDASERQSTLDYLAKARAEFIAKTADPAHSPNNAAPRFTR